MDPTAKVIMVTSYDQDDLREAAKDVGAMAYVRKDNLLELVAISTAERDPNDSLNRSGTEDRE